MGRLNKAMGLLYSDNGSAYNYKLLHSDPQAQPGTNFMDIIRKTLRPSIQRPLILVLEMRASYL